MAGPWEWPLEIQPPLCSQTEVFSQALSTHPASRIDELLPDRWEAIRRGREATTPAPVSGGSADPDGPVAELKRLRSGIDPQP
jgi:hypothetical protein